MVSKVIQKKYTCLYLIIYFYLIKRLHNAVQAYFQLLEFCYALSVHEDPGMRENAEILLSKKTRKINLFNYFLSCEANTFYMPEYRDALVTLARTYDGVKSDK